MVVSLYFDFRWIFIHYHPRMPKGNVFVVSVCASIRAVTFEGDKIETFFVSTEYLPAE